MRIRSLRVRLLFAAALWGGSIIAGAAAVSSLRFRAHLERRHENNPAVISQDPEYAFVRPSSVLAFGLGAVVLAVGGLLAARWALAPLDGLRDRLGAVRSGLSSRLEGEYPSEIQPTVEEVNELLEHNAAAVRRATTQADNLAHGLKTPLSLIRSEATSLERQGHLEAAARLEQQVQRMQRHVDLQLTRVRAVASGPAVGSRCDVGATVGKLVRVMQRLHPDRVRIEIGSSQPVFVKSDAPDVEEMLGNLLDNACKFASSRVMVSWQANPERAVIMVEDDGPGLPPDARDAVFQRGTRLDESVPGTGLGLAITREIAAVYHGAVELSCAESGGLRASLVLPAVQG